MISTSDEEINIQGNYVSSTNLAADGRDEF